MQVIDKAITPDGTEIQLEDWHSKNTEAYPDLHGYTIGAYPIAKNTNKYGLIKTGEVLLETNMQNIPMIWYLQIMKR